MNRSSAPLMCTPEPSTSQSASRSRQARSWPWPFAWRTLLVATSLTTNSTSSFLCSDMPASAAWRPANLRTAWSVPIPNGSTWRGTFGSGSGSPNA